jgi:glutamyl-tRNA reductase
MTDMEKVIEEAKAEVLPFDCWEQLTGESGAAYTAFCRYRDFGSERNIRKAVEEHYKGEDISVVSKHYKIWRQWSMKFQWVKRAAEYDRYLEKLKQAELRKTIEAQGEKHRQVTGKMLDVVSKKLDTMNPEDLTQTAVTEWVQTAIKAEREAAELAVPNGRTEAKQGELQFVSDFQGL